MSELSKTLRIVGEPQRDYARAVIDRIVIGGERVWEVVIRAAEDRRTTQQNARLWACCTDIARQVEWHGRYLDKESWKQMFVAALKGQDAVPGINGGFVVIGGSSRRLRKHEFIDLIDIIQAFGAERDVTWSDDAREAIQSTRSAA